MTTKELRAEWCKTKGFNYIDFDTLREAEEYILFLESKIEALNIADVGGNEAESEVAVCNHPWEKLDWNSETRIDCECGESFFRFTN